jgi:predicted glycoside hydrolase/deacetylase ChbG (UPF0249 family)
MKNGTFVPLGLCADDYAISPAVSAGIVELLAAGRLTATSAITTRPLWRSAAKDLHRGGIDADIGLHLNLTLGAPLSRMPAFAPGGEFPGIGKIVRAAQSHSLPEAEIRAEIAHQLDAFCDAFGAPPAFVDGHQHVQILPRLRGWLFDALFERGLTGKLWLRDSTDGVSRILRRSVERRKALLIAWLGRGFAEQARQRGFTTNEGFSGFSNFSAGRDFATDFTRYLQAPGKRHLVMCHPGYVDEELRRLDPVTASRPRELAFLISARFEDILAQNRMRLARLSS